MELYENKQKKCECWKCEINGTCQYKDKFQRLPKPTGLGLCKKLKDEDR